MTDEHCSLLASSQEKPEQVWEACTSFLRDCTLALQLSRFKNVSIRKLWASHPTCQMTEVLNNSRMLELWLSAHLQQQKIGSTLLKKRQINQCYLAMKIRFGVFALQEWTPLIFCVQLHEILAHVIFSADKLIYSWHCKLVICSPHRCQLQWWPMSTSVR